MTIKDQLDLITHRISEIGRENLSIYQKGGIEVNFPSIKHLLDNYCSNLDLMNGNLDIFDTYSDIDFAKTLTEVLNSIINIHNTSENDIMSKKNILINGFMDAYSNFNNNYFPKFLSMYNLKQNTSGNIAKIKKQLVTSQKNLTDLENSLVKKSELFDQKIEDFERLKKEYNVVTQEGGVDNNIEIFKEESNLNLRLANNFWDPLKILTIIFFILLIVATNIGFHIISSTESSNIYPMSVNIILSSVLFLILAQFFKRYNAYLHLHKVNKHKANCLKTFKAFVESADSDEVKREVLTQSTKVIFEAPETGFVKSPDEKSGNFIIDHIVDRANQV